MQKKVSFIVPKVNASGEGKVSESVLRKLLKYTTINDDDTVINLITVNVNGEPLDMEYVSCVWDNIDYYIFYTGNTLFEITRAGDVTIDTGEVSEGDRIDLFFSFENDITIEEKVHSSFEGLANGNVKFKVWRNGDIVIPAGTEDFSRTFITIVRQGTDEGSMAFLMDNDSEDIVYSISNSLIWSIKRINEELNTTESDAIMPGYLGFTGNFKLSSSTYDTVLLELVIE